MRIVPFQTRKEIKKLTEQYNRVINDLIESREWFQTTLKSIGDAVLVVDVDSKIKFLNPLAEQLTGWSVSEALGRPMADVINIVNEETRLPAFNPVDRVLAEGVVVGLANHTILISRDGKEYPIADSAAPIRHSGGKV